MPSPKDDRYLKSPDLKVIGVSLCSSCEMADEAPYKAVFEVSIQTDAVALYVWLEAQGIVN